MKRKLFITLVLSLFAIGAVITTNVAQNDVSLEDIRVMAMADVTDEELPPDDPGGGSGNTATCYSTYTEPLLGVGGTKIWVCGSCVQTKAKTFSDSSICYF